MTQMFIYRRAYPAAGLYPLIDVIGEGFTGDVSSRALSGMKGPFLQYDLPLADDDQRSSTHFNPLKDVILHRLRERGMKN